MDAEGFDVLTWRFVDPLAAAQKTSIVELARRSLCDHEVPMDHVGECHPSRRRPDASARTGPRESMASTAASATCNRWASAPARSLGPSEPTPTKVLRYAEPVGQP